MSRDNRVCAGDDGVIKFWDRKPVLTSFGRWTDLNPVPGTMPGLMRVEFVQNAPRRGQCVEIDGPPRVEVTVKRKAKKGAKAK